MSSFSNKTKTSSTSSTSSTPLDQYAPYINQGLQSAQKVMNDNQANSEALGGKALDVYNGLGAAQNTLGGIYGGTNPAQAAYGSLQHAGANDPSMAHLTTLANGSTSPGNYDGIGTANPSLGILQGMTNGQTNGDSSQFYKDTLGGKYLNANPYLDAIAQQGTDAATKGVNSRFAASGMGEGMSTPYAQALGSSVADANNQFRYGAYKDELSRMGQIGSQSDSEYNATQDRNLSAANSLGSQYNQSGQLQLGAQQAKDTAFNSDRNSQLAAAQSLGSQYNADNNTQLGAANGNLQAILSALGMQPGMAGAQIGALGASAQLPYTGVNNYAGLINGLTAKYGNTNGTSNSTSTTSTGLGNVVAGLAGSALGGFASGGFGGLGSFFGGSGLGGAAGNIMPALSDSNSLLGSTPLKQLNF